MAEGFRWQIAEEEAQQAMFSVDEALDRRKGIGEFKGLEFLHVRAKKIINEVPGASRMPFRFTINAYRGCSHACVYCFARPTHEYLNLNVGDDFDTKIVVKVNAVERVRAEVASPKWTGEGIAMGTNTDPYQRAEGKYQLTRGIVKALSDAQNPFSILTKSTLILRDIDLLAEAAQRTSVQTNFSIATLDADVWRATEPGTPHPRQRVAALRRLVEAGVDCGVLMAPVLPGISDRPDQLAEVADACVDAGASWIAAMPLHLKSGVKDHWFEWLSDRHPELVRDYREMYSGRAYLPTKERDRVAKLGTELVDGARQRRGMAGMSPGKKSRLRLRKAEQQPGSESSQQLELERFEANGTKSAR